MCRCPLLLCLLALPGISQTLEITRPARPWEFLDAVGSKAAIFGFENGTVEAWVFPFKIVKDLRLRFRVEGREIPGEAVARRIVSRPESCSILYSGDDFTVRETFRAVVNEPAVVIELAIEAHSPLEIQAAFGRDFQAMWPASIGSSYAEWTDQVPGYRFGADGYPYAAVLGSADAKMVDREYATNYSRALESTFSLGSVRGKAVRTIAIAGSMKSREDALAVYRRALRSRAEDAAVYYRNYLARTLRLELPDARLQRAYDWSRVSLVEGMVDNPLLGEGLVAGYGSSKGGYRPGFAWFFGRDTFWSSLALTAARDLGSACKAIRFIAGFQREDGKLPHEISQSAPLVKWFEQFRYGYASADATPLFVIALRDYTEASGDLGLARELWPRVEKALAFMRATADADGFPRNLDVGHGWVEGGPLLPVRTEFYQAGTFVEALRSAGVLAQALGQTGESEKLAAQSGAQKQKLQQMFWRDRDAAYAFAIGKDGQAVTVPSVLAAVPMWFGVADGASSRRMIAALADEDHASDWGMRILSRNHPLYSPAGYHFGSVWPLFTGWASVAEYRAHAAQAGWANLSANAWLAVDGAGGNTAEVLSGETYSALSTGSPHQIWSAAMVVSPVVRGMLGLTVNRLAKRIDFEPHLPADWNRVAIHGEAFDAGLELFDRKLTLQYRSRGLTMRFAPALAPGTEVIGADLDGTPLTWAREDGGWDWHPVFDLPAMDGESTVVVRLRGSFGYKPRLRPARLGEPSSNLKILEERWSAGGLELTVSGLAGSEYAIEMYGERRPASVSGATLMLGSRQLTVRIPGSEGDGYRRHTIGLRWK